MLTTKKALSAKEKRRVAHKKKANQTKKAQRVTLRAIMPLMRHIVIHSTQTPPNISLSDVDKMPYHYIITKAGKLLKAKEFTAKDTACEIALLGGLDKEGNRCDTRTAAQSEALFNLLVLTTELFPRATIVPADQLYVYSYANPGYDLKGWLNDYIPEFLQAA